MPEIPKPEKLVIVSRESRLAMWQSEFVRSALQKLYPECAVSILGITTRGDQILDRSLSKVGGKGLFVKELENALLDGRADLAVHSLKDVPMDLPPGFSLAAVMDRADPRDALVSNQFESLEALPPGSVVGTSSLRREAALRARFPHLQVRPLRGNLDTRLAKLDRGEYAAIILAAAGLERLGLEHRIRARLSVESCLPAAAQGALGIETLADRPELIAALAPLNHRASALAAAAERAVSRALGGSCSIPLAAYACWQLDRLNLKALLATPDGLQVLHASGTDSVTDSNDAERLGGEVAARLTEQGAARIIAALLAVDGAPGAEAD